MRLPCIALTLVVRLVGAGSLSQAPTGATAFVNDYWYDKAAYGNHPAQQFVSAAELEAPQANILRWDEACETELYTTMTPRGWATAQPQATILDYKGELVWTTAWDNRQLYNLMVQEYRGESYLTFWAGNDGVGVDTIGGHGSGTIIMLDKYYDVFKEIRAANDLEADLHEFRLTDAGTALLTVYEVVEVDLSAVGKATGPIWDCLIQEVDVETGEAVFQWRASEHWAVDDGYAPIGDNGEAGRAWDYFHLNSIDKDARGNYLVSSRYMRSLSYVDGATGEVLWVLGGKRNMFADLSGGRATDFAYQHDARWADNRTAITMFDNGNDGGHAHHGPTRGLKIRVDEAAMTAEVLGDYRNPRGIKGLSQGSYQTLPGGGGGDGGGDEEAGHHVLLGYGLSPAYTEFAADGTPLCDVHFGPQSRFGTGDVQSYRTYKSAWRGYPGTPPAAALRRVGIDRWKVYVSWNGATEVVRWELQGAGPQDDENALLLDETWEMLRSDNKVTFETAVPLPRACPPYLRVVALDTDGEMLGVTDTIDASNLTDAVSCTNRIPPIPQIIHPPDHLHALGGSG
ncbi:ASST-domain-containing protein [Xylariomycetidae sp. FL0641]|nr:ASST-domain-containing protein [Xylariomycetidae sp. FL0641]